MVECYLCTREYLTEADPHAFIFVKGEWKNNCGCYFTKELNKKMDVLINHDIDEYREVVEYLEEQLELSIKDSQKWMKQAQQLYGQLEEAKKEAAIYKAILDIKTNKG